MNKTLKNLIKAETYANQFFKEIENSGIIKPGKSEKEINGEILKLAREQFDIKKFWHKMIVRSGKNTLLHYGHNPPDLILQEDDIIFLDLGPVFDKWETDIGKTYVLGSDKKKLKLKNNIEQAWAEGKNFYSKNKNHLTGADFYNYTKNLAKQYGWEYDTPHCGHLIGEFHHELALGDGVNNYIHPENQQLMCEKDIKGNERHWIYEIHFIDKELGIGGFFEQMLI